MVTLSGATVPAKTISGIRPVNLQTDLAPLADLIELVFADSMDSGGRAALREMRAISKMGLGTRLLSRLNETTLGINLGYVWVENDRLIGNVSVYAAHWPSNLGSAWIIANVGVHPDFQGRGIARRLMIESMRMIQRRGGTAAILQVDMENHVARHLYRSLGFIEERGWTTWRRSSYSRVPLLPDGSEAFITHRRRGEWQDEMRLAALTRQEERGGIGWLRPLHERYFRKSPLSLLNDWASLRGVERLVVRAGNPERLVASLWVESGFAMRTLLTLLVDPQVQGTVDEALLNTAVRRFGRSPLSIEHPSEDMAANELFERYRFVRQRSVMHMRWDAAGS
ncbi:MAG: GNAT family N-acetyltransferase [bacterium]|nr:GNAT family N-acetyltransferase [bacterium]